MKSFKVYENHSISFTVNVKDTNGTAYTPTGLLKASFAPADNYNKIALTIAQGAGITLTGSQIKVEIDAAQNTLKPNDYVFDMREDKPDGTSVLLTQVIITIVPTVTII